MIKYLRNRSLCVLVTTQNQWQAGHSRLHRQNRQLHQTVRLLQLAGFEIKTWFFQNAKKLFNQPAQSIPVHNLLRLFNRLDLMGREQAPMDRFLIANHALRPYSNLNDCQVDGASQSLFIYSGI
ncbi:MAG: hypothetical protein PHG00_06475 [Methylococcales bacterium]|nr:hypothetical protein [Methylococcales bacterium]